MRKVTLIDAVAAIHDEKNVDTDQICPARFLHTPRAEGYADKLFRDLRFDADGRQTDFVLNREPFSAAQILISGDNFGCGSSREQAVWALDDFGIRAVIAPKFGDIFRGNCVKNGILPIAIDANRLSDIKDAVANSVTVQIDLPSQALRTGSASCFFEIDAFSKERLVEGKTEIAETLLDDQDLKRFEERYALDYPWLHI